MLKACSYCGRIHDTKSICKQKAEATAKRQKRYGTTDKDKFRWTRTWQKKRKDIRDRDSNLCQACKADKIFTYENLSVHHIEPLVDNFELRLEDSNLITLCDKHHELAESGEISKDYLLSLVIPTQSI